MSKECIHLIRTTTHWK